MMFRRTNIEYARHPMFKRAFLFVACTTLLTACSTAGRLDGMHESAALRLVNIDLQERIQRLRLETPGYELHTIGQPGAGSCGGNGVFIGLVPTHGGEAIDLPLEYDYTFTLSEGDTNVHVTIVHSPSDEELRLAVEKALQER